MRVTHVIKAVGIAGAERHLVTLLAGLREHGLDADLILLVENALPLEEYVSLLKDRSVPVDRHIMRKHLDPGLFFWLRNELAARHPQIVHTHLLHADLYGIPAAKTVGARVISSRHNEDPFRASWPLRPILQALWHVTDAGIAISAAMARFCIEQENAPASKLVTIPYGMDHDESKIDKKSARARLRSALHLADDAVLIGMISRLIEQKGVSFGVRAFAQIADQFPQAHLIIAGDGDLRGALESEATGLGIHAQTHFLGWRNDVPDLMAALDIFLMPSLWEGFGLTLLEAMAAALPVIGTRIGAIPEVVLDGETGVLVPKEDVNGIAHALGLLLQDSPLRHHMGMMGQDRLETKFSTRRMVDETLALYERLLRSQ